MAIRRRLVSKSQSGHVMRKSTFVEPWAKGRMPTLLRYGRYSRHIQSLKAPLHLRHRGRASMTGCCGAGLVTGCGRGLSHLIQASRSRTQWSMGRGMVCLTLTGHQGNRAILAGVIP